MPVTTDPPTSLRVESTLEGFTARIDGLAPIEKSGSMRIIFWTAFSAVAGGSFLTVIAAINDAVSLAVAIPVLLVNVCLWAVWYASRPVTTVVELDAHRLLLKGGDLDASVPLESVIRADIREYVPGLPWLVVHTADRAFEILARGHSRPDAQWLARRIAVLAEEARARPALSRETVAQAEALLERGTEQDRASF